MSDYLKSQKEIGQYIKENRERIGYKTAKEFSALLDVSPATVSNWENGIKAPTYTNYVMMAGLFGLSVDDLLTTKNVDELFDNHDLYSYFSNDNLFSGLTVEKRKELIDYYIHIKEELLFDFKWFCTNPAHLIEAEESLLKMPCANIYSHCYSEGVVYFVEKVDDNFDLKRLDNNSIKEEGFNNCLKNGLVFISYDKHYPETDEAKEDGFYIEDKKANKAYAKMIDFFDNDDIKRLIDKVVNFVTDTEYEDLKIWDLFTISDDRSVAFLNSFSNAILFNEDFNELRDEYIKSLTSLEKHLLLKEYIKQCDIRNINPRVNVLFDFLNNGTKLIINFNAININYDYKKTLELSQILMSYLNDNKECIKNVDFKRMISILSNNLF